MNEGFLCVQLTLLKWIRQRFLCYPLLKKADEADKAYWHSKSPQKFEALELMRQINYDYDPGYRRLQRVLEVAEIHTKLISSHRWICCSYHGYPRTTADYGYFGSQSRKENAEKLMAVLREFGFDNTGTSRRLFLRQNQIIEWETLL